MMKKTSSFRMYRELFAGARFGVDVGGFGSESMRKRNA
jgi:hypothetical protein